ncbi:MAG: thymidine phosphorylase [Saccharofermentanales bacterium]
MRMYDILESKRDKSELSKDMIEFFVKGVTDGSIPDYQISALLMAICINGMTPRETCDLTVAMAHSGTINDLSSIKGTVVDKHSSGGVGDKCTLIIGPIVSSFGIPFAKLSGRGLGHTGGTIDKLESIKGFRTSFSSEDFISQVNDIGIVLAGQSGELAPADKKLYALRDVTATIQSIPLISASIMSKKIASGADNILLDVKCGNGAFMKTQEEAFKLASLMVQIGELSGRNVKAYVTDMSQPLGNSIGNALEIAESCDVLNNKGPEDLKQICISLSAGMMELAGLGSFEKCRMMAEESLQNGTAFSKFRQLVLAQGGELDAEGNPVLLGNAEAVSEVLAISDGYVDDIITDHIGTASLLLGAGREKKEDKIDPAAGIIVHKKRGDPVKTGESLATLYTNKADAVANASAVVLDAYHIGSNPPAKIPIVIKIFGSARKDS